MLHNTDHLCGFGWWINTSDFGEPFGLYDTRARRENMRARARAQSELVGFFHNHALTLTFEIAKKTLVFSH